MWLDKFDWVYRDHDYACFTMTIHPDVSSKPHVLTMHERIFAHISRHFGVRGATFAEIACDFIERRPRKGNECVHRGAGIRSLARRPATDAPDRDRQGRGSGAREASLAAFNRLATAA
jgi:hypothetical protein